MEEENFRKPLGCFWLVYTPIKNATEWSFEASCGSYTNRSAEAFLSERLNIDNYNLGNNILDLSKDLVQVLLATNKTELYIYYKKLCVQASPQVDTGSTPLVNRPFIPCEIIRWDNRYIYS